MGNRTFDRSCPLFEGEPRPDNGWRPEAPPDLSGIHNIFLNYETTSLRWWDTGRPISIGLSLEDGRSWYLPWGHRGGGNLDEETVKRWAQRELRGKHITNINTKFDCHMSRVWGIDLEEQGNTVSDVGHYAALLDDHRYQTSLDTLIPEFLPDVEWVPRLDESRMASYHAGECERRARFQVQMVHKLRDTFWPMLDEQDLQRVRSLEDRVIFPTVEMEKNGAPIDEELLDRWIKESQVKLNGYLRKIAEDLGWQCNPDSPKDMARAFQQLGLPIERTAKGAPSFTDAILKSIPHPTVRTMRLATKLASLRSKFLVNTKKVLSENGILRYQLNQLRVAKDEFADAGESGTVTGRYSSSAMERDKEGCNIQQRMKAARQRIGFGYDEDDSSHDDEIYLVRKLHVAAKGSQVISSDMDQCQYRIFASYANNPKVIQAYRDDPHTSFHKFMWTLISPYADLSYRQQKDLDFAYLFGAGVTKMALMMEHISAAEFDEIRAKKAYDHPKLAKTKEVKRIFEREVPELRGVLDLASHLGKPACDSKCKRGDRLHKQGVPHRGYVCTVLGRRMRFPDGQRLHKAFNGVDQGSEADVMKTKMVEVHRVRKEIGFTPRITNHDELVGDGDRGTAERLHKILNEQSFPEFQVPLTWSTGIGPNWADVKDI